MIRRAQAATTNGFESMGVYAAAVVAANTAGVPVAQLNALTLGYVAGRLGYNVIYVWLQQNRKLAPLRSALWYVFPSMFADPITASSSGTGSGRRRGRWRGGRGSM